MCLRFKIPSYYLCHSQGSKSNFLKTIHEDNIDLQEQALLDAKREDVKLLVNQNLCYSCKQNMKDMSKLQQMGSDDVTSSSNQRQFMVIASLSIFRRKYL